MRVAFRLDVALGAAQRAKIPGHVFRVGVVGDERADHESRIDDLSETELFEQVVGSAEGVARCGLAFDQQLQPVPERAAKVENDPVAVEKTQQGLQRRVMTSRMIPNLLLNDSCNK